MFFPTTIVSGGQTGADRAGLDFAIEVGLLHGGFCPKGRRAKDGPISSTYNLKETASDGWSERTRLNVATSDATVIFSRKPLSELREVKRGSGSALTIRECQRARKPFVVLSNYTSPSTDADELRSFLNTARPVTLNVAGNSEDTAPGTYQHVLATLRLSFLPEP